VRPKDQLHHEQAATTAFPFHKTSGKGIINTIIGTSAVFVP
jgi:hypothetical protein